MSDYEATSPRENLPSDLESDKTSEPTVVEGVEGAASASPLPPVPSSRWPISTTMSEQAFRQKGRGSFSHLRRGLIAAAALMGSVTGLFLGLGTSPSASAAQSVAGTSSTGQLASVGGGSNAAAGGSSGTVGSVFRSSFTLSSVTLTTSAGQEVTVDGVSSTRSQSETSSTSKPPNTYSGRP
jgi:hypothetical protein